MEKTWESRATLYELLAKTFLFTEREVVEAVVSGDYGEALTDLLEVNGLKTAIDSKELSQLSRYHHRDEDEVFHGLRREYTRLYIGARDPLVAPFVGTWDAMERGQKPLLFVGRKSMEVERFMQKCGMVQADGTNEPLDHIGSMLEFLMHLCMLKAGLVNPPEGIEVPNNAYEDFYKEHFIGFAHKFAAKTIEQSDEEFFTVAARVLSIFPVNPL